MPEHTFAEAPMRNSKVLLRDEVREKIIRMILENGTAKGERILPEKDLGKLLNVNHLTVRSACAELVEKNVLYKIPGHGTFFNEFPDRKQPAAGGIVGILMQEEEHFYNGIRNQIVEKLQQKNCLCRIQLVPTAGSDRILPLIREMLQNKVSSLVIMQTELEYSPDAVRFLAEHPDAFRSIVRIFGNGAGRDRYPGNGVTLDYERLYRSYIRRLKDAGIRRIAYLGADCSPDYRRGMANRRFLMIYVQEMIAAGLENYIMLRSTRDDRNEIERLLTGSERPEAVICLTDFLAMKVYETARELGIRVPEDLSLFGAYDTPWSRHFNLGTCRVDPRKFADAVARAVFAGGSGSVEYVDCDVIERSSVKPEMKTVNGK